MQIEAPKDESPKMSKMDLAKDHWAKVKDGNMVFPSILANAWIELEDKPKIADIEKYVERIKDNQSIYYYKFKRERGHKAKRADLDDDIINNAARMAYYLDNE